MPSNAVPKPIEMNMFGMAQDLPRRGAAEILDLTPNATEGDIPGAEKIHSRRCHSGLSDRYAAEPCDSHRRRP